MRRASCLRRSLFFAPLLSLAACLPPQPVQVSQSSAGAYEAALATGDGGFTVAWYDTRDGHPEIYLRSIDEQGRLDGPERRLTAGAVSSFEASVERVGDALVVAWYEQAKDGSQTAMLGAWGRDGVRKWSHAIAPASRNPVIRADGESIVGAWIQRAADGSDAVWIGSWDREGTGSRTPRRIGAASRDTWNINLAVDRSTAWVVFDATAGTRASELFLGRADHSVTALQRLTRDDGAASKYPDLKIDGGRAALTWYDSRDGNDEVYLLVGRLADLRGDIDGTARRVTTTDGESIGAYVAWNEGRVGLAWSDKTSGQHEIYFQAFDDAGDPVAAVEQLTHNASWSLVPAIRAWGDGFALAWNEYQPSSTRVHDGTSQVAFTLVR